MKKVFTLLATIIIVSSLCAQIEPGQMVHAKYVNKYTLNMYSGEYEETISEWYSSYFLFEDDFYVFMVDGQEDDPTKVWWEYYNSNEYGDDIYVNEYGTQILIDYENQSVTFYNDWNEGYEMYESILTISKIELLED
ncbi:MAG: hypothetical protein CMN34_02330 [Saprospirales bacterium]|nr:hypothetical protein [Saprospirales bacterium]|tara:strand:+ start:2490 stop:2900 length:411 start_codon:yes stop_codon:yes gene_type:complete